MTSSALTEHDQILSYRFQSELCVESSYAVDFSRFYACHLGYVIYGVYRKIPVYILGLLQYCYQTARHFCVLLQHRCQILKLSFPVLSAVAITTFFTHVKFLPQNYTTFISCEHCNYTITKNRFESNCIQSIFCFF